MRGRACHQFERPPQHSLRAEMHRPCASRLVIDNVAPEQERRQDTAQSRWAHSVHKDLHRTCSSVQVQVAIAAYSPLDEAAAIPS